MSTHPKPLTIDQRLHQAETEGHQAGTEYEQLIQETCPPEKWTPTARAEWSGLLRKLRTNPYGWHTHTHSAQTWALAFGRGRDERRATINHETTVNT